MVKNSSAMQETMVQLLGQEDSPREGIGYPLQYSWASLVAQRVKNLPAMRETWVGKFPWGRDRLTTPVFLGFPGGSESKESACNAGDLGSIPGWEDPMEEGMATHSSILAWRIPMDRGAWQATVHGVTKSRI